LATEAANRFNACAARWDLGLGAVVGSGGRVLAIDQKKATELAVPGAPDLDTVAVDVGGRIWATSPGKIWLYDPADAGAWACVWKNESWGASFVGLFADVGRVIATTRDGAVVEGRWEPR
jgi:hypothetical protein